MATINWNLSCEYGHILYKTLVIDFIMSLHWTNKPQSLYDVTSPQVIDNPFIKILHCTGR